MTSIIVWMLAFTISLCLTILSAAAGNVALHMGATALVTLAIAIVAVQSDRQLEGPAVRSARAASTARFTALCWIWSGTAIFVTYNFILRNWPEWWQFSIGLLLVGGLTFLLAMVFERDAIAGREDESLLKIARTLNVIQIVGMLAAAIGLIADHKFLFGFGPLRPDWAGNDIMFFGAIAVACIGVHALAADQRRSRAASV